MNRIFVGGSFAIVLLVLFVGQVSAAVNTSGLVNSYNFVTGNNSVAPDNLSRNNFDVSGATYGNPYSNIGEYRFDSNNANHEMNTNSTLDSSLRETHERTFLIWFNASKYAPGVNDYLFSSGSPTSNSHFSVAVQSSSQKIVISEGITEYGNIKPPQNYTFVAAVYNGSALRLYVNGSLDITQAAASLNTTSSKLKLGDRIDGSNEQYNGTIISVFLYNRTLSATEILDWYNQGAHFNPFANVTEEAPTPEPNIWNLSGKNVFVTNTSRDVAIGAKVPSQRLHVNGSANITGTMYVGRIGINKPNPAHDLHIGDGTYSELDAGEAQFTTGSSREYKQNIVPVHVKVLENIAKIPVNTYDFKPEYCGVLQSCTNKLGLIAEDFHTIFGRGSDKELNGQEVQMALWLAVQELHEEVTTLKEQNALLKETLCNLNPKAEVC